MVLLNEAVARECPPMAHDSFPSQAAKRHYVVLSQKTLRKVILTRCSGAQKRPLMLGDSTQHCEEAPKSSDSPFTGAMVLQLPGRNNLTLKLGAGAHRCARRELLGCCKEGIINEIKVVAVSTKQLLQRKLTVVLRLQSLLSTTAFFSFLMQDSCDGISQYFYF